MSEKMRYFTIVICLIITGFILKPVEASEIDPYVVGEIIINSELVICESNVCSYYDQPSRLLKHNQTFPDGYIIVYPGDKAKPEERIAAREHVVEYWTQYMRTN